MKNSILTITDLKKIYHDKNGETLAIDGIDLDVQDKEFISIVGPSGCGKSTLLSILANLEKQSNGTIYKNNNLKIGYMLQSDSLFPWRTVLDNCLLGLEINKNLNNTSKERVIELLKAYGLYDFKDKYPRNLSGGMRQRVALIRTLALDPDILLLDEPFSALDYQTRLSLADDVSNIIKKEKKTVIMVTHDLAEAISLSDKIVVLTKRPAKVKSIYTIDIDKSMSPTKKRRTEKFNSYYDKIWKEIDKNV